MDFGSNGDNNEEELDAGFIVKVLAVCWFIVLLVTIWINLKN